jgi:hypothetical protein
MMFSTRSIRKINWMSNKRFMHAGAGGEGGGGGGGGDYSIFLIITTGLILLWKLPPGGCGTGAHPTPRLFN